MADTKVTEDVEKSSVINASQSSENVNSTSKSKDAFDVLMKSRNKVIGSNSPGKELQASPNDTNDGSRERKIKRKLILEEWAMAKGGNLNKQKDTLREEMIKKTLKQRKTKFTNMLVKSTDEINQEKPDKPNSSPNVSKKHKIFTPRSVKKKVETNKRSFIVSDDEEFLEKLSPSLKKKENLLCYLKKENRESNFEQKNDSSDSSDSNKVLNQIKVKIISKRITNSVDKKRKVHSPCISNKSSSNSSKNIDDERLDKNNINKSDVSECMEIVNGENHENSKDFSENGSNRLRRSQRINTSRSIIVKNRDFVFPNSGSSDTSEDDCVALKNNTSLKHNGKENIILLSDSPPPNLKTNSSKTSKKSKTDNPPSKKIKLAPLFTKGTVKPFIDHEALKARQNFLYSSLEPSSKAPQLEPVLESNIFHIVTHIKQIPDLNSPEFHIWNLPSLVNGLVYDEECVLDKVLDSKNLVSLRVNEDKPISDVFNKIQTYNMKDGLLKLKTIHPKYPIIKFFKQMRQKHIDSKKNGFDNNVDEECCIIGTSDNVVTENTCIVEKNDYDNVLWTEKYKPLSSNESIGNFKSVELLKKWLMSWKDYGRELSSMKKKVDSDSSSEFWSSDSNSRQSSGFIDNTYVLTGPVGSGKTSSIYAIANELNINVIEVNASSKRTGKKILKKLQEATQSHKVKIGNKSDKIKDDKPNIFSNKKSNSTEKKKKKERLLKAKSKLSNEISSSPTKDKMSLILIEDADIVFDEDDGFINALSQIVRFSKRPVVIVATEINCPHLKKFVSDHNIVKFHPLSGHIVSPWFNLLMLMESNKIYPMLCQLLVHFNKGDIRKTIMNLHCWILGNRKNDPTIIKCVENNSINEDITLISHCSDNEDSSSRDINIKEDDDICDSKSDIVIAENSSFDVLNDIIYLSPKQEISWNIAKFHCNISNNLKSKNHDIDFNSLCQTLEVISSIDHLQSYKKNITESGVYIPRWCYTGDNLLELERQDEYYDDFTSNYCSEMIACNEHLQNSSNSVSLHEAFSADFEKENWSKKQNLVYFQLCEFVPISSLLDRRSLSTDYMAYLRNICNSEKLRQDTNVKRNNRFCHYFSNLNADFNEKTSKIFRTN